MIYEGKSQDASELGDSYILRSMGESTGIAIEVLCGRESPARSPTISSVVGYPCG